jgi:hypothetical protein
MLVAVTGSHPIVQMYASLSLDNIPGKSYIRVIASESLRPTIGHTHV